SLELCLHQHFLKFVDPQYIDSVIIQSQERYEYLFKKAAFRTFYIQNAPAFKEITIKKERKGLIYAGTAQKTFGFYQCLEYLVAYRNEKLFVQGTVSPVDRKKVNSDYAELVEQERLV